MSGNTAIEARFVRVDDEGRLVLDIDGEQATLTVGDTLLRGIEEARRRQSEAKEATGRSIPISAIQALVRQGVSIADIAKDYGVSESQVSRFAQPILVERKLAIEQFLSLPVPRPASETRAPRPRRLASVHSIGDLVRERFRMEGAPRATVEWTASRKPRQPWHITAIIHTASRTLNAMWMWNVADGTVSAVNPTATWIFEGGDTGFDRIPPILSDELPGTLRDADSVIAQDARMLGDAADAAHAEATAGNLPTGASPVAPSPAAETAGARVGGATGGTEESGTTEIGAHADGSEGHGSGRPTQTTPDTNGPAGNAPEADVSAPAVEEEQSTSAQAAKRRNRRTAVPSWDEIMFGEGAAS